MRNTACSLALTGLVAFATPCFAGLEELSGSSPGALLARLQSEPRTEALSERNANYAIDVALDVETHQLQGHEVVSYRNLGKVPMTEVRMHTTSCPIAPLFETAYRLKLDSVVMTPTIR